MDAYTWRVADGAGLARRDSSASHDARAEACKVEREGGRYIYDVECASSGHVGGDIDLVWELGDVYLEAGLTSASSSVSSPIKASIRLGRDEGDCEVLSAGAARVKRPARPMRWRYWSDAEVEVDPSFTSGRS